MIGALAPYRVLDLTTEMGALCTRLFAGLGADVIRIEPPGGHRDRRRSPFAGYPGSNRSLYWLQMNANKRGITLAIDTADGRDLLLQLVERTDVMVTSSAVNGRAAPGLSCEQIRQRNPRIVITTISAWGSTGPRTDEPASDLIAVAAGGLAYLCGDVDRAPVRPSVDQGFLQVGIQAAVGTLIALTRREAGGDGEIVDVSMQEAVVNTLGNARLYYAMQGMISQRAGGGRAFGSSGTRLVYPCADGFIAFYRRPESFVPLAKWLQDEGVQAGIEVEAWSGRSLVGPDAPPASEVAALDAVIEPFFAPRTRRYLYSEGQRRGLMICEVASPADIAVSPQLSERGFFDEVEYPVPRSAVSCPGAPFRLSATPWQATRPSPRIGEHNHEIFCGELGLTSTDLAALCGAGVI